MTHKGLVNRVSNWLKYTQHYRCSIVCSELVTAVLETPDVIGFYGHGNSVLCECKISRSDFMSDKNKWFRREEKMGMGNFRYFCAPEGLLSIEEIPKGWGLLEVGKHSCRITKEADRKEANKQNEVKFLMSIIRRLEISTAVFVKQTER
jgi:hypothetical protein